MADKVEMIKVKPTGTDDRVVLFETHPDHPDGEVFIAAHEDAEVVEVAKTPRVLGCLSEGTLVEVKGRTKAG